MLAARMRAACALSAKCLFHFRINFGLLHSIFHFIRLCFWISGNFQQRRVLHATGSYKEWSLMLLSGAVGRAHSNRRRWHQYCKLPQGRGFQYLHYIRERVMMRKSFPSPWTGPWTCNHAVDGRWISAADCVDFYAAGFGWEVSRSFQRTILMSMRPFSRTILRHSLHLFRKNSICLPGWRKKNVLPQREGQSFLAKVIVPVRSEWNYLFFWRLLAIPARPARPVPKRSMVAGSGTGAAATVEKSSSP